MPKTSFTEHPEFHRVSLAVSKSLESLADSFGLRAELEKFEIEGTANRLADDLAKLVLRMYDMPSARARRNDRTARIVQLLAMARGNKALAAFAEPIDTTPAGGGRQRRARARRESGAVVR